MSFIQNDNSSKVYAPGYFLAHPENAERETRTIPQSMGVTGKDGKYVPAGTVFPEVGSNAEGIVYEDVDVTSGDMPGSVVTKGDVWVQRIPLTEEQMTASTLTALQGKGFSLLMGSVLPVVRPY